MEITEVFYPRDRREWRAGLETYHKTKPEVWVRTLRKATGKPSSPYDDMVEECLCFGWIDGVVKKYGEDGVAQRITPRRGRCTRRFREQNAVFEISTPAVLV